MAIDRPDQFWCADITYIPMRRGFLYLVAIMDWYSRRVLSWRRSNTMETDVCIEALKEVLSRFGRPGMLLGAGVRVSMDGRGRCMDNVFIERLWRSLKYECIDLNAFATGSEARAGIGRWSPTATAQGHTRPSAAERRRRSERPATASTWRRNAPQNQA